MSSNIDALKGNWNYPTTIWFGCGRINELPRACQQLGINNPLLVTDAGLVKLPMIAQALKLNLQANLPTAVFSNIKLNPNGKNIEDGVAQYKLDKHDGVIAFGGGSALDAAKAIALMAGQTRPIWEFEDVGDNWLRVDPRGVAPTIAIPTTAGTGSEVGRASVIVDDEAHVKKIIFHPKMLPSIVIEDPELTTGLPAQMTAATGMDALAHNLEAYCSSGYHPLADGIALEGIRLIKNWLPVACKEPTNLEARSHMLIASSMGATAFQKGLGAMHALAHPLGALYDAHHGTLNAILMPYVINRNRNAIANKMQHLARCLELTDTSVDGILAWIIDLRKAIGIPNNLKAIGIDADRAEQIGKMATEDPSAGGNPILLDETQYAELFTGAVNGKN